MESREALQEASFKELLDELLVRYEATTGSRSGSKGSAFGERAKASRAPAPQRPAPSTAHGASAARRETDFEREEARLKDDPALCEVLAHTGSLKHGTVWPLWQELKRRPPKPNVPVERHMTSSMSESSERGGDVLRSNSRLSVLMIRPDSVLRLLWDTLSMLALSVDLVVIPLMLLPLAGTVLDRIGKALLMFWTVDMGFSFLTGYHDLGFLEMRPAKIARRYCTGFFVVDIWCCLLEAAAIIMENATPESVGVVRIGKVPRVARLLRVLRLVRVLRAFKAIQRLRVISSYTRSQSMNVVTNVSMRLMVILMLNHYIACLWYSAGTFQFEQRSWLDSFAGRDISYVYSTALHWSITQFTPASMEVHPRNASERVIAIFVILVGMVTFSFVISTITGAMSEFHRFTVAREKQTGDIKQFIVDNRLSLNLGGRIHSFLRAYSFTEPARLHEGDLPVLAVLPESLRVRLRYEIYRPVLASHPLMEHLDFASGSCMKKLCSAAMSEMSLILSEELFATEVEVTTMYFVFSGTLEYFPDWKDTPCREIEEGEWIYEAALWLKWISGGRGAALTPCELMVLNAAVFRRVIGCCPEVYKVTVRYALRFAELVLSGDHGESLAAWSNKPVVGGILQEALADKGPSTDVFAAGES